MTTRVAGQKPAPALTQAKPKTLLHASSGKRKQSMRQIRAPLVDLISASFECGICARFRVYYSICNNEKGEQTNLFGQERERGLSCMQTLRPVHVRPQCIFLYVERERERACVCVFFSKQNTPFLQYWKSVHLFIRSLEHLKKHVC